MSIYNDKFRKARRDYSPYLFHFIKGDDLYPRDTMRQILNEMKLRSKNGYICFSASPLTSIGRFFETNTNRTGRPMYSPFGIGFNRDILVRDFGAKNVIYYDNDEKTLIPQELKWRSLPLKVDVYDYEYLREWRIQGNEFDFTEFDKDQIIIVAPNEKELNDLIVSHDVEFKPIVDYINGDIDPDWDEIFKRDWKGIAVDTAEDFTDDFAIFSNAKIQKIGQDMTDDIFGSFPFFLGDKSI